MAINKSHKKLIKYSFSDYLSNSKDLLKEVIVAYEYKIVMQNELNKMITSMPYKLWQKYNQTKSTTLNFFIFLNPFFKKKILDNPRVVVILDLTSPNFLDQLVSISEQSYPNINLFLIGNKLINKYKNILDQNKLKFELLPILKCCDQIKKIKSKYFCYLKPNYILKPSYLEKCIIKMEIENLDFCSSKLTSKPLSNKIKSSPVNSLLSTVPTCCVFTKSYLFNKNNKKISVKIKISEPLIKLIKK